MHGRDASSEFVPSTPLEFPIVPAHIVALVKMHARADDSWRLAPCMRSCLQQAMVATEEDPNVEKQMTLRRIGVSLLQESISVSTTKVQSERLDTSPYILETQAKRLASVIL